MLRLSGRVLATAFAAVVVTIPVSAQEADVSPVTEAMLENPADGDWLSWRRTGRPLRAALVGLVLGVALCLFLYVTFVSILKVPLA